MLRIRAAFIAALVALLCHSANAQTKQIVNQFALTASPQSSHIFDDARVEVYDDGTVTLFGDGSYQAGGPQTVLDYTVDIDNQTYTVTEVDPATLPMALLQEPGMEMEASNLDPKLLGADGLADLDGREGLDAATRVAGIRPGYWWGRVQVKTLDPIFIELTRTSNRLHWYTYSNGRVQWTYYYLSWWSANPSPLNTHWYISNYAHYGPFPLAANTQVYHRMTGDYLNYDFGLPNYATQVHETAAITARNDGYFNYSWNHTDSGEGSFLIFGRLVLN